MKNLLTVLLLFTCLTTSAQIKKAFKFSTFYIAANGGTSLADEDIYSAQSGILAYDTVFTPYDYSLTMGVRKIKRFQYEDVSKFKEGYDALIDKTYALAMQTAQKDKVVFNLKDIQDTAGTVLAGVQGKMARKDSTGNNVYQRLGGELQGDIKNLLTQLRAMDPEVGTIAVEKFNKKNYNSLVANFEKLFSSLTIVASVRRYILSPVSLTFFVVGVPSFFSKDISNSSGFCGKN